MILHWLLLILSYTMGGIGLLVFMVMLGITSITLLFSVTVAYASVVTIDIYKTVKSSKY